MFSCFAVHSLRAVAMLFNIFRKLKEIGVLQPVFPDYVISYDYGRIFIVNQLGNFLTNE